MGVAGELIVGMRGDEGRQRPLRLGVFMLAQQAEGVFVLLLGGAIGQCGRGRRRHAGAGRGNRPSGVPGVERADRERSQGAWLAGRGRSEGLLGRRGLRRRRNRRLGLARRALPSGGFGLRPLDRGEAEINVADQLVDAVGHLIDAVRDLLDLAGERPDLVLEFAEPNLGPRRARRGVGIRQRHGRRRNVALGDEALDVDEVLAQPRKLVVQRPQIGVLGHRRDRRPASDRQANHQGERRQSKSEPYCHPNPCTTRRASRPGENLEEFRNPPGPRHRGVDRDRAQFKKTLRVACAGQLTTVTPRRFCDHAASLWPKASGRSLP